MALPWFCADVITPLHGVPAVDYGDAKTLLWDDPDEGAPVEGCSVQPVGSGETQDQREAISSRVMLFLPTLVPDLRGEDRFRDERNGAVYQVDGEVLPFPDPTGAGLDHSYCYGELVRG